MKSDKRRFHFYPPLLTFGNIAKHCLMIAVAAIGLCLAGCDEYDDTELWNAVKDHEQRLAALEQWQAEVNNNIAALQTLLNTNDMITDVTPVTMGDEVTGYTISFLHNAPITIYNGTQGEKGETGDTPQIGLTQQEDGNWYWTLNGELMRDAEGNPIRANGEDGKDGQDGQDGEDGEDGQDGSTGAPGRPGQDGKPAPIPEIKLGSSLKDDAGANILPEGSQIEDDAWYLNVDDTNNWYRVSGKDGESGQNGDAFFESVAASEDGKYYIFTLSDENNTQIKVPLYQGITISFTDIDDLSQPIGMLDSKEIAFTVTGNPVVTALTDTEGWEATVSNNNTITVTREENAAETCNLVVLATNNAGSSISYTLRLAYGYSYDASNNTYTVATATGLQAWATAVNSDLSISCTLAADITLPSVGEGESNWTAVGNGSNAYTGTFDGAGHTVSGMKVIGPSSSGTNAMCQGFFGNVKGTITRLHIKEASVSGTGSNVGGIAGQLGGSIIGCSYSGTVTGSDNFAGGIVGLIITNSTLTGCYSSGTVKGSSYIGGIVGNIIEGSVITGCYSIATIEGSNFVGVVMGMGSYTTINACYWSGNGVGIAQNMGGTGSAVQVTGSDWTEAMNAMNQAISESGFQYKKNDNTGDNEPPLILEETHL